MGNKHSITNLNGNHYHHIIDNIYIGDMESINERFFKKQKKLFIVNATRHVDFNTKLMSIDYRVSVDDDLHPESIYKMYKKLPEVTELIEYYNKKGYKILVHCVAGRQRSCAIVAAYLMRYKYYSIGDAVYFIKSKRPFAFFGNVNFKNALFNFSKLIYNHKL